VLAIVAVRCSVLTRDCFGRPVSVLLGDQDHLSATSSACRKDSASTSRCRCSCGYWLREVLHGNLGQSIFLQRR
jgi:peptide/nickel transport system permease protein